MAAMLALEQAIDDQLGAIASGMDDDVVVGQPLEILLSRLRELTGSQRRALVARLQAVAPGVSVPELTAPTSSLHRFEASEHPASAALFTLHATYSQAVIGYAVLMELANRAADNVEMLGADNSADVARQHMRAYAAATREIVRTLPEVVVNELEREGQECQCVCPSCGLGVCVCWLAFRRQLELAWADAAPLDAMTGIEMVRPRSGSAADRARLREGDVLLAVDGAAIESIPMLQESIRSHPSGEEIRFDVQRGSERREEVRVVRE